MKNELNIILRVFIYLVIVRHAINIPQQLIKLTTGIYDNTICLFTIGLSILIIAVLYYILKVKKWALVSFFILQYINALTIGTIEGKGDYFTHLIVSTIFCGLISALLFLKKNGASGWIMFLGREDKGSVITNDETPCDINPINDSCSLPEDAITDNTGKNILNNPTEDKKVVDNETQPNNAETIIASIPKKEDGSINYEAMDIYQQFEYTCVTESKDVAIKDLKKEISIKEKERKELYRELASLTGGKRAEQRDIIRGKENNIQELKNLLSSTGKGQRTKKKIIVLICVILAIVVSIPSYIMYSNHQKQLEIATFKLTICNKIKKCGYTDKYEEIIESMNLPLRKYIIYSALKYKHKKDLASSYEEFVNKLGYKNSNLIQDLYDALKKEGYNPPEYDTFRKDMQDDKNLQGVYNSLKKEGYTLPEYNVFKQDIFSDKNLLNEEFKELVLTDKIEDNKSFIAPYSDKDVLSSLYHALVGKGYSIDDLGDESTFRSKMVDKNNRKELYDYVSSRGDFRIGDYDSYEKRLSAAIGKRWVFDTLVKNNYDLGSFDSFLGNMEDENKRKEIYRTLIKENCNVGTFEEFETGLGYIQK